MLPSRSANHQIGGSHMQLALTHCRLPAQRWPQPPQLLASVNASTQT
jgi:hypothetical protein